MDLLECILIWIKKIVNSGAGSGGNTLTSVWGGRKVLSYVFSKVFEIV